jgi:hypothetical protein
MRSNNYLRETPEERLKRISPELAALLKNTLDRKTNDIQAQHKNLLLRQTYNTTAKTIERPLVNNARALPLPSAMPFPSAIPLPSLLPFVNNIPVENSILRREISGNLVCSKLSAGLGNRIFQMLAALGYAEKYGKQCVISKANSNNGLKAHEKNLDGMLFKLFPNVPVIDRVENLRVISELKTFNYSKLPNSLSNVILYGYFQDERYFPSALIPKIKTDHYPNTYFIHIRAGDYLPKGSFGYDLSYYHKKCFNLLSPDTKYIVFSDDNTYATNYMKQFSISYTISNKVNQLDTLIEMSNCEGAICANSSFSWLGAFFQDKKKGQRFMPSQWIKGIDCTGVYPTWATIVDVSMSSNIIIKQNIEIFENLLYFSEWQKLYKDPYKLIVQASSICGGDLWMPFPIGMNWTYVKYFDNNPTWQIGLHDKLVLCAVKIITDKRRRSSGINREQIINTLGKNSIQNIKLEPHIYFSSLPSYKFIISPEGNGIDCHRHYEALIAGCIPIIEYNEKIEEKYRGLPILYTKDYSEITPEYLENKYNEMANQQYDFSRLFLSYYSNEQQEEIRKCGSYWIKKFCGHSSEWYTPNIVWITLINKGYVDFTKNFLESMKYNNCIFSIIVYCTDEETVKNLQGYSNVTCIDARPFLKSNVSKSLSSWGAMDYKALVFAKLDAIKYASLQYKNSYIGYIDTDIILFKNPTKTVINTFKSNPDTVFVSQCDEPRAECSNTNNCQHICSGVIVFKNTLAIDNLLKYSISDINSLSSDQEFIINMANKYNIKHVTVDKNIFLNGVYPGVNNLDIPLVVPPSADLIHYNYLVGSNKIKLMRKNKMWYLENSNEAVIIKSHNAGMGSLFNSLILQINEIKTKYPKSFPVVIWDTTNYGEGNIFNKYFSIKGFNSSSNYTVKKILSSGMCFSENIPNYRSILHALYKQHILVNPIITDKVNSIFINKKFDYLIGVHFRNTDRVIEADHASPGIDKVSKRVVDVLNEYTGKKLAIYIASDNKPDVIYFKKYLNELYEGGYELELIEDPDNVRSDNQISIHGTHDEGNTIFTPEQKALSILVDIYALAKCDILVRTCSNVTCSSGIINKDSKIIDVSLEHGKITEKWLSESI